MTPLKLHFAFYFKLIRKKIIYVPQKIVCLIDKLFISVWQETEIFIEKSNNPG